MNPQEIAKKINLPVEDWPGRCHEVACLIVAAKLVRGKPIYGHYHGDIHPDSIFGGRPFTHHGWITRKTTLVDATRWVFECADPYIYVGPKDDPDYDPGGNRLRKMMLNPPPSFNAEQKMFELPPGLATFAQLLLGEQRSAICSQQVMWLASLPLDALGDQAEPLYRWVIESYRGSSPSTTD